MCSHIKRIILHVKEQIMNETEILALQVEELKKRLRIAESALAKSKRIDRISDMILAAQPSLWTEKCCFKTDEDVRKEINQVMDEIKKEVIDKRNTLFGSLV